ncbi:MAG: histidine kinase dimerization/phospho-acceptor domain-containing protein [Coraliomargarita sp.]
MAVIKKETLIPDRRVRYLLYAVLVGCFLWLVQSLFGYWMSSKASGESLVDLALAKHSENALSNFAFLVLLISAGLILGIREQRNRELSAEVRRLAREFQEYFIHAPHALLVIDQNFSIHDANPSACRIFSRSRVELMGMNLGHAFNCATGQSKPCCGNSECEGCTLRFLCEQAQLHNRSQESEQPARFLTIDPDTGEKKLRQFKTSVAPVRVKGQDFVCIALAEVSEELRLRKALARVSKTREHFLSVVSHELRTPLNPICGFAQMMIQELEGEHQEMMVKVLEAADKELSLVEELIDYTDLTSKSHEPNHDKFNLINLLTDAFDQQTAYLTNHSEIQFALFNGIEGMDKVNHEQLVFGDMILISKAVIHLLRELRKTTSNGKITMYTALGFDNHPRSPWQTMRVRIVAEGSDIHPSDSALLHALKQEPFENNSQVAASGLGVKIAEEIASILSGEFSIQREHNKVSATLEIPVKLDKEALVQVADHNS